MDLETVQGNAHVYLRDTLELISRKTEDERSGAAYTMAAYLYRRIAICELLAEARADRFAAFLCKSGLVRLHFLRLVSAGHSAAPMHLCASRSAPFVDALAAGALDLAVDIARLTPAQHVPGVEYEDDFLLHRFLQKLTLQLHAGEPSDLSVMLERWEVVLEGGEDPYLAACRALLDKNPRALNEALRELIAERKRSFQEEKRQPGPQDHRLTEGYVFMNGLALLRLAEMLGMPVQSEYPTIPRFARLSLGRTPPPPTSWREPTLAVPA